MKRNEIIAIFLMFMATLGTIIGILAIEKYRRNQLFTVELIARAPDHGNWYPRQIKVPVNQETRLLIRNIETVTHGFALPEFNLAVKEIKAGEAVSLKFTPDKRGTFPFMCTVWCSDRHMEMTGELIVE